MTAALGSLLTLSGSARAQYGGNSGSMGWMPQYRPNTSGYNPNDLDWIGLDYTISRTYAPGVTGSPSASGKIYKQGGLREGFGTLNSSGPLGDILSVTLSVTGTSEYHWLWTPTNVPSTQQPDYNHFPGPALFTLGRVSMMLDGLSYGLLAHIQGSISVSGGGAQWMDSDSRPDSLDFVGPLQQTAGLLSRSVLSAGGGNHPSVQMSPALSATGTAAPDRPDGRSTQGGRIDSGLGSDAFPITLSSPQPFGLPQMGDDSNKFVYDGTMPNGILTLPLAARVIGANQADTQWLVDNNKVGWAVHPGIDGWIPYPQKVAQGDTILPVTNGQSGVALYQGLPDNDADFGLKEVLLKVQGLDSQKAYIQTFFSATAKNHPHPALFPETDEVTGLPIGPGPNWFYYYNKLYSSAPARYADTSPSYCLAGLQFDSQGEPIDIDKRQIVKRIIIGNDAFSNGSVPVFKRGLFGMMTFDGLLDIGGIHKYVYVLGHELGHAEDYTTGILNYKFNPSKTTNQIGNTGYYGFDEDGDGVTRKAELANGLDPLKPDSTGAFGGSATGDAEVLACIHGLAKLLPTKDLWKQDWSSAGLQYSGLHDPFWGLYNPDPMYSAYWGLPVNTPYHPWDYESVIVQFGIIQRTGNHNSDPPSDAVTQVLDPYSQLPYP